MPLEIEIKLLPADAFDEQKTRDAVALSQPHIASDINSIQLIKRSIDARKKPIVYVLKLNVFLNGEVPESTVNQFEIKQNGFSQKVAIIGCGPAGIFAAFQLLERGIQPIIIERGKPVKERRRDLAALNKELLVNPESNYCFGEGGAGTYSDGKLYTRSKKRGSVERVLQTFVQYGANADILIDAHPHIGTNKLPHIIEKMRESILANGGEIHFDTKLTDFKIVDGAIESIVCNNDTEIPVSAVILATGHSARDIFHLLNDKKILVEAKPFALGVRIEHPQHIIDTIQYKQIKRDENLPPAAYSIVTQAEGCGVFSFCMCPGGIIAPAATDKNETVVNGWSPSKRNGAFANSGLVVTVEPKHWQAQYGMGPLSALAFQQSVEHTAYQSTGSIIAPAQRVEDFIQNKISSTLPECSYIPGIKSIELKHILPDFIIKAMRTGLTHFGKTMHGYRTSEAVLVGVESRTSSPVRIPRNKENLQHPEIKNLFPCGEGAGYAGGIVSAAIDGMVCANAV
ncbi:MAG: FAD-binding protein [bacterium]|nr:FAD-binding protein [bacterium]